jgi:hypothetical protein
VAYAYQCASGSRPEDDLLLKRGIKSKCCLICWTCQEDTMREPMNPQNEVQAFAERCATSCGFRGCMVGIPGCHSGSRAKRRMDASDTQNEQSDPLTENLGARAQPSGSRG